MARWQIRLMLSPVEMMVVRRALEAHKERGHQDEARERVLRRLGRLRQRYDDQRSGVEGPDEV